MLVFVLMQIDLVFWVVFEFGQNWVVDGVNDYVFVVIGDVDDVFVWQWVVVGCVGEFLIGFKFCNGVFGVDFVVFGGKFGIQC